MRIVTLLTVLALLAPTLLTSPVLAQDAPEPAPVAVEDIPTPSDTPAAVEDAPEPSLDASEDVVAPDLQSIDPEFLFSVGGLAVFGVLFTVFIRKLIPDVPVLGSVPVVLWPTIGAGVGMLIGLGLGVFDGDVKTTTTQIIVAGILAVGGHASLKNIGKTSANTK